jgi:hypothetical protein
MATKFAEVLARDLLEELPLRTGLVVTDLGLGTNGDPLIRIGTGATTTQSALLRIVSESTLQVNSVGVAQTVYTPHSIQIAVEQQFDNASSPALISGVAVLTLANISKVLAAVLPKGTKVEIFIVAAADMPLNEADFADSDTLLVATLYPHMYHPLTAQS